MKLVKSIFSESNEKIVLTFNNPISDFNLEQLSFKLNQTQSLDSESLFKVTNLKIDGTKIVFYLNLDGEYTGGTISINLQNSNNYVLKHKTLNYSIFIDFPIIVENAKWVRNHAAEEALSTMGSATKGVVSTLTVIVIPASASVGILLIKVIQMFDYLTFLNVDRPSNLNAFLSIFQSNLLSFLPNPFAIDSYDDTQENDERRLLVDISSQSTRHKCITNNIMRDNELSCYFFNSVGDILIHFLAYLVFKLIIVAVSKILIKFMLNTLDKEREESSKDNFPQNEKNPTMLGKIRDSILKLNKGMSFSFFHSVF